eukprot:GFUD01040979.1.p1 GENE.GFUD01040979.1~~GFUD01040979.1.p1  ORF type:complete len:965 (+),score=307.98 GFUD01040979.1:49-2895(+)
MEGPDIPGPKVWLDLNRKCEAKIIAFLNKNKERSSWLKQYVEDCKVKLGAADPEPTFVPKTPAQPKRGGRRVKASLASKDGDNDVSNNSTRSTRATRGAKRDVTVTPEKIENVVQDIDTTEKDTVSYTPPPKKANISIPDKSVVFSAEPVNATYSSQDSLVDESSSSSTANATFEVGSQQKVDNNATFEAEPSTGVSNATFEKENKNEEVCQDSFTENEQFIQAEAVVKPAEVAVNNIVEILKNVQKEEEKMPSPIPAPRSINKTAVQDEVDSKPSRSTRTKAKNDTSTASTGDASTNKTKDDENAVDVSVKRSTRTKAKNDTSTASIEGEDSAQPTRSTRTRQKNIPCPEETNPAVVQEIVEDARAVRSTRTKQKQLAQTCSESALTKGAASPRVRELAAQVHSPALKNSKSPKKVGYTGSPVSDRVKVFEQAMRDSAGLKTKVVKEIVLKKQSRNSNRRSSIADSLSRVSAARNLSVNDVLTEQEVNIVNPATKKGPTIKKNYSPVAATSSSNLNNSRAPAGKVVRPGRKVFASGGRGVSPATGPRSGSNTGSSSNLMRSRSRLDIIERNGRITPSKGNAPNNLVKNGITSFLPSKPKGPTLEEIQEQKDDERKMKEQREIEAKQRREDQMKNKMEEQKNKREERIRRVQEARQKQESQREDKLRKNQEKDKEEKLAMLKKREENLKAEAEKRKKENEMKLKEAEEKRSREDEERLARKDQLDMEKREDERRKDEEQKKRKQKEDEERKKKMQDEDKRKRQEEQRREDEKRKGEEDKKRAAAAQQERIVREREEMKKIKEREATRQAELNSTYNKPSDATLNKTQTMDQSNAGVSSYDMTPARHELPPEPSKDEDNYGLDDLKSGEDTDDEDCPRKQVPKWAEGTQLRTALLKQCYMGPDLDKIFCTVEMPDLSTMFDHQRKRFFKRTSSAVWETPPESFKHSKRW